ncbi:hypothetical protein AN402_15 [Bacillus wiedmannii]|nr:hypothetical protein AN402_15 [Bacillus wiedmannii]
MKRTTELVLGLIGGVASAVEVEGAGGVIV